MPAPTTTRSAVKAAVADPCPVAEPVVPDPVPEDTEEIYIERTVAEVDRGQPPHAVSGGSNRLRSASSVFAQDGKSCSPQNQQIHRERPVLDIAQIHTD